MGNDTVETICAHNSVDLDDVLERVDINEWWSKSYDFLGEVWERDWDSLTPKQRNWVDRIVRSVLDDER